jgi:hypothetical protein
MADGAIQPHIHDCIVNVQEGQHTYRYRVFFKRHRRLRFNQSSPLRAGRNTLRGDIVVMRMGTLHPRPVINMRARDSAISDFMIPR